MFIVIGEFFLCCMVVVGGIWIHKAHPKLSDGVFFAYVTFTMFNYFAVRWRHERLKWKVRKFKKTRRKFLNFDFGTPDPPSPPSPPGTSAPPKTPSKKSK
jgi:hypothetical protein